MELDLQKTKAALRKQMRAALHQFLSEARNAASTQICARLVEQAFWQNAASVLFFAPLPDEADVWPLLAETVAGGKIAALPRFDEADRAYVACRVQNLRSEIRVGQFGIREPKSGCVEVPMSRLDLILVPGVAFDAGGRRLGRGRGFYDRLLVETEGVKCGIAFDEQIAEEVPAGEHDQAMDFILTPTRCLSVTSASDR